MAAFALGLVGDPSARMPLLAALADPDPLVEATPPRRWACWVRADATAVSDMVLRHAWAGALASIGFDDLAYPLAPPVEAARLGFYALVRLARGAGCGGSRCFRSARFDMVAGRLCRCNGSAMLRATPALVALLNTPGRYTPAFAARGSAS